MKYKKKGRPAKRNPVFMIRNERLDSIIDHVCESFYISREEALRQSRKRELVIARQAICYIAREIEHGKGKKEFTLNQIAAHLGVRDHVIVSHGVKTMKKDMETDKLLNVKMEELKYAIGNELSVTIKTTGGDQFRQEESFETPDEETFYFLNPVCKQIEPIEE